MLYQLGLQNVPIGIALPILIGQNNVKSVKMFGTFKNYAYLCSVIQEQR